MLQKHIFHFCTDSCFWASNRNKKDGVKGQFRAMNRVINVFSAFCSQWKMSGGTCRGNVPELGAAAAAAAAAAAVTADHISSMMQRSGRVSKLSFLWRVPHLRDRAVHRNSSNCRVHASTLFTTPWTRSFSVRPTSNLQDKKCSIQNLPVKRIWISHPRQHSSVPLVVWISPPFYDAVS